MPIRGRVRVRVRIRAVQEGIGTDLERNTRGHPWSEMQLAEIQQLAPWNLRWEP